MEETEGEDCLLMKDTMINDETGAGNLGSREPHSMSQQHV